MRQSSLLTRCRPEAPEAPAVAALRLCAHALPDRDRATAASLLGQSRQGLTPKQTALAESLVARASAPPAARTDGLEPIVEMLALAGTKLKWPVIRFEADGVRYRLGLSGAASRNPRSVSVTTDERACDARTYFGRIDPLGVFEPHYKQAAAGTAIGAALRAFAAAPAEQARLYGQRFGQCCFCGLELTNKASIQAGYGPICADKYGLPWGD